MPTNTEVFNDGFLRAAGALGAPYTNPGGLAIVAAGGSVGAINDGASRDVSVPPGNASGVIGISSRISVILNDT